MAKDSKKTRKVERAERDEAAVGRFVERFALILSEAGFPRMPARVFVGLLITEEGRSTAAELAELLRVSPAAISIAVRYLMQVGLVSREREPGERRDQYRVHSDMWYESVTRRDAMLARWDVGLQEGIAAVGADTPAGARLDESRRFFEFVRGELPQMMRKWKEQRGARGQT
jgi:predicted transcriptional regulator